MTRDRKAYFREYQRQRYAQKKQELAASDTPDDTPAFRARFRAECERLGLIGQSKWRARAKLKRELGGADSTSNTFYQKFLHARARDSARDRNIPFDLKPEDIPLPKLCVVLQVALDYVKLTDPASKYKPSIDRIDNSRGYTRGNIQVISHRANILKRDATKAELRALGAWASSQADD